MGTSKLSFYTDNQIQLSRAFKALGHPARIAIVELLCQHEQLNISNLNTFIPLTQSNISRHCNELFLAGLVAKTSVMNNTFFRLNTPVLLQLIDYLEVLESKKGGINIPPSLLYYFKSIQINPRIRTYIT